MTTRFSFLTPYRKYIKRYITRITPLNPQQTAIFITAEFRNPSRMTHTEFKNPKAITAVNFRNPKTATATEFIQLKEII